MYSPRYFKVVNNNSVNCVQETRGQSKITADRSSATSVFCTSSMQSDKLAQISALVGSRNVAEANISTRGLVSVRDPCENVSFNNLSCSMTDNHVKPASSYDPLSRFGNRQ